VVVVILQVQQLVLVQLGCIADLDLLRVEAVNGHLVDLREQRRARELTILEEVDSVVVAWQGRGLEPVLCLVGIERRLKELFNEVQVLRREANLHTRMIVLRKTIQANRVKLLRHLLEQRKLIRRRPLHEVARVILRISEDEGLNGSWHVRIANAAADVVEDVLDVFQAGGADRLDIAEEAAFHDLHELGIHLNQLLDDLVVSDLPLASRKSVVGHDWLY
jgi:hypothetical protein